MHMPKRFMTLTLAALLAICGGSLFAEDGKDAWISLFDGETLGCWEGGGEAAAGALKLGVVEDAVAAQPHLHRAGLFRYAHP